MAKKPISPKQSHPDKFKSAPMKGAKAAPATKKAMGKRGARGC